MHKDVNDHAPNFIVNEYHVTVPGNKQTGYITNTSW